MVLGDLKIELPVGRESLNFSSRRQNPACQESGILCLPLPGTLAAKLSHLRIRNILCRSMASIFVCDQSFYLYVTTTHSDLTIDLCSNRHFCSSLESRLLIRQFVEVLERIVAKLDRALPHAYDGSAVLSHSRSEMRLPRQDILHVADAMAL